MSTYQRFIKRFFDVVLAGGVLVALSPVIAVCVLVASRDTGLCGIYAQRRVGRHGKAFNVYKIRSMRHIEKLEGNTITIENDARITRAGRLMRRWKLDELPQLWNVVTGEMSLVGPRPDVPGYADRLTGKERAILELRPGITGPATIKYRNEEFLLARQIDPTAYNDRILYPDKVRINLVYLRDWSLMGDIYYILITVGLLSRPQNLDACEPTDCHAGKQG